MKKKHVLIILCIATVFILGILIGGIVYTAEGLGITVGHTIKSYNGTVFLVDGNTPIRLTDTTENGKLLSSVTDGDKIIIFHGVVNETYPASTGVYFSVKLKDGSIEDISPEVINTLTQYGWLGTEEPGNDEAKEQLTGDKITKSNENGNFSLILPEDWDYEEISSDTDCSFGISIFHKDSPAETVSIEFTAFFGVCGTGLRVEEITLGGFNASKGIYDGNPTFDYIVFNDTPGYYVIYNHTDAEWWSEHGNTAMKILDSLTIADGIIFREKAVQIASQYSEGEYQRRVSEYDIENGIWTISFEKDGTEEKIKLDKQGIYQEN